MTVGEKVKTFIGSRGISQSYISKATGISTTKLNLALNGKRNLTFEEYENICWTLGVDASKFLTPHPPNQPS